VASTQAQHLCTALIAGGAVAAVAWVWANSNTPSVTFDERAVNQSYSPYVHFLHSSPMAWVKHFPDRVGANCLPLIYQNEDIGQAVRGVEIADASYAQ
jgi:hypothetical protein